MFSSRHRLSFLALLSAGMLCGCGHAATPLAISPVTVATQAAPAATIAPATVTVSRASVAQPQGKLAVRFDGAFNTFLAQTANAGVDAIRVTLTGAALSTPVVEEATPDQIVADQGQVLFQGLPGGAVAMRLEARNFKGDVVGQTTIRATIADSRTTVVATTLAFGSAAH
ncbi:MAG TPA: hypothetical protein V6D47_01630 [Oscillatoriaceae cyanobacterium]